MNITCIKVVHLYLNIKLDKMKLKQIVYLLFLSGIILSCIPEKKEPKFNHFVEQFSDIKVLRYKIPGFEELTLKEKSLVYYLTQDRKSVV